MTKNNNVTRYVFLDSDNAPRYYRSLIRSFKDRHSEAIWNRQFTKRLSRNVAKLAYRKLAMIHAAGALDDLRVPPANRLEALKGDRTGQHSIRVNDQFRICFVWDGSDAYDVEIVDYH